MTVPRFHRGAVTSWWSVLHRVDRATVHGFLLCLFAALIPVGEGAAYIALGLVTLMCLLDARRCLKALRDRPTTFTMLIALAVWFVCGIAAVMMSGHGWLRPAELGRWPPLLAMFVVVASTAVAHERWVKRAAVAFTVMLLVSCAFGLVQYGFNVRPGEFLTRTESLSQALVPGEQRSVAGGFYFHRLKMGHVLLVGLAVASARVFFAELGKKRWVLEAGLATVFAVTMFLTYTRGAMLGGAVACLTCLPFVRGRLRWTALGALVVGVVLATSLPGVRGRMMSAGSEEASSVRGLVWSQGVRIIADHPLGVGLGNYSALVGRYYDTVRPEFTVRTYPHSMVLAAWAETGPLGLFAYLWVWASFGVLCAKALLGTATPMRRAAAGCGLFLAVSLGVVGLTHDLLYHNAVALAFAAGIGAVLALIDDPTIRAVQRSSLARIA